MPDRPSTIPRRKRPGKARRMLGLVDISVPHFGYKNHVSIDRKRRFVRGETCTDTARYDGHELASVPDATNQFKVGLGRYRVLLRQHRSLAEDPRLPALTSTAKSHAVSLWPNTSDAGMRPALPCALASNMCSATRRGQWRSRSAQSVRRGPQDA